ncbi:hypothetical protein [Pseudoclavibacter terrae]|uniref:hypothetical protein n=1 Tax=Pseudoclavibacter terrae TaxID=1530195 RepID=UPI00232F8B6B|nr:hypothetical protein [Pseudoclavibacter terrae]
MYTFEKIEDEFNYGEASSNHTLISHMPGANPIEEIIHLMAGAASEGAALLYAVGFEPTDHTDFSTLFTEQSSDPTPVLRSVADIVRGRIHLSPYMMNRRPAKTPVYLFIEDLSSVLKGSHEAKASLELIAREGRAVGVYFVAATERTDRQILDKMRARFVEQIIIKPEGEESEAPTETGPDDVVYLDPMETPLKPYEASPLFEKFEGDSIDVHKVLDALAKLFDRRKN